MFLQNNCIFNSQKNIYSYVSCSILLTTPATESLWRKNVWMALWCKHNLVRVPFSSIWILYRISFLKSRKCPWFRWCSVLYLCNHSSGWVRNKQNFCWRNIWMVLNSLQPFCIKENQSFDKSDYFLRCILQKSDVCYMCIE